MTHMHLWMLAVGVLGCRGPDLTEDGFVLIDEAARQRGIAIEVSGERHDGRLPVVVHEGADTRVIRPSGPEAITVDPGELLRIIGPEGDLEFGSAPRNRVLVDGDMHEILALADMVGGRARRRASGDWVLEGPDAFVRLALMRGMGVAASVRLGTPSTVTPRAAEHVQLFLQPDAVHASDRPTPAPTGPIPDAAALVGLYAHAGVSLLLDASGGYAVFAEDLDRPVRRGRFTPCQGGVELIANDGHSRTRLTLTGEHLVDELGIDFQP